MVVRSLLVNWWLIIGAKWDYVEWESEATKSGLFCSLHLAMHNTQKPTRKFSLHLAMHNTHREIEKNNFLCVFYSFFDTRNIVFSSHLHFNKLPIWIYFLEKRIVSNEQNDIGCHENMYRVIAGWGWCNYKVTCLNKLD